MKYVFSILSFLSFLIINRIVSQKIAIIGCGIGGSSQAYYLANSLNNAEIHIFDENKLCGGRIKNVKIVHNITSEVGANFFILQNELLVNLIKDLNLTSHIAKGDDNSISFWDGKQVYFQLGNWKVINLFKMFYRYGFAMLKAKVALNEHLVKFIKFYTKIISKPGKKTKTFRSLKTMLKGMKLLNLVNNTTVNYLLSFGINENFIEEFFQSIIASLYNQDKNINAFAGFVTLAALLNEPYSITGGNIKLIKRLIKSTKNILGDRMRIFRRVRVFEIEKKKKNFELKFKKLNAMNDTEYSTLSYDIVVFAVPLSQSSVNFINFESIHPRNFEEFKYKKTFVNYIAGDLKYSVFNFINAEEIPYLILSNNPKSTLVSEIKTICKGCYGFNNRKVNVYQVQANHNLTKEEIEILFDSHKLIYSQEWKYAYPKLDPVNIDDLPDFEIDKNVFHINAIEKASSCMEMILISSKNIANIITNKLNNVPKNNKKKKNKRKKKDGL